MKNIIKSACLLLISTCLFTACEDDNFYNPTVQEPSTFKLNTPAYSSSNIDLARSTSVNLTWSQPDYGFPAAAQYTVQMSLDGNFTTSFAEEEADETGATVSNYFDLENVYNSCNVDLDPAAVAKGLQQVAKWAEDAVPANQTVYARVKASLNGVPDVYSNTVTLNFAPYYVELKDSPIEIWYLIGSCIGDGSWSNSVDAVGTAMIPMYTKAGEEYNKKDGTGTIQYVGYLTTSGFKLVKNPGSWDDQWGQGDAFGTFVMNDDGSGNITVPADGYYTVELNTATDELTVTPYDGAPTVYASMSIPGDFNGWDVATAMSPINSFDGAVNHDWFYTLDASAGDTTAKFAANGAWDVNWGSVDFPYGFGTQNGDNIPVAQGSYIVVFNDILGAYSFISK
ncbi:MAG: SusE domain-containing protein [Prevotella sp.]|nr:SusE domain-containing protein [Prevotella sp.]